MGEMRHAARGGAGRRLVLARARGGQARRGRADGLVQPRLDVHVQVLEVVTPVEATGLDLTAHVPKPADDGLGVGLRHDALPAQHPRMGDRRLDIVRVEPPVVVDGDGVTRGGREVMRRIISHSPPILAARARPLTHSPAQGAGLGHGRRCPAGSWPGGE